MLTKLFGLGLAATGVAHFIAPAAFEPITKPAFPEDTRDWVLRHGAAETAIGLAITVPATRKFGFAALGAYGAWLGVNGAKNLG